MQVPKILVVEDENLVALDLQARLQELGFQVSAVVASGEEAVLLVQESPPDAVLMDIKLRGGLDGIEAARQIRDIADLPVIYLTAYSEETLLLRAKQTAPYAYLIKPFVNRELKMAIDLALARHASEQARKEAYQNLEQQVAARTAELFSANCALRQYCDEIQQTKKQVERQSALLNAINRILYQALSCPGEKELWQTCMQVAQELTGSKISFIGEIGGTGHFDTIAASDAGWEACRRPTSAASCLLNNLEVRNVLETGRSLVANGPTTLPEGAHHPPITSFLGVPLKEAGGRVLGMIALANKEGGYEAADQGEVEHLSVALVEALQRWRSEEALRQAELKYRIVANNTYDWVFWVSPEKKFLYISGACRRITGYGPEDFEAHSKLMLRIIHPDDLQLFLHHAQEMKNSGPGALEYRIVTADGRIRWISHICLPVFSPEGQFLGRRGSNRDITESKQAEEALREEHAFRSAVIARAAEGLCVSHNIPEYPYVKFTVWNARMTEITGYALEEINRLGWQQTLFPDPELRARIKERMAGMRQGDDLRSESWEITRADGERRVLNISTSIVTTIKDTVHVLAMMHDVTEQKEMEQTKKKLEAQLFQAQKMEALGTLAGGIAHDFNNILASMLGYTELALDDASEGTKLQTNLFRVVRGCTRARDLIKQILTFSRPEKTERKLLSLQPLIKETLVFLRSSLPSTIEIRTRLHAEKALVVADPTQIHQVLLNLATNAAQAMEEKGGVLEIESNVVQLTPEAASLDEGITPGPYLELQVSDTGQGMEPSVLERIFDPFFTTKEPGKGTGMGLAVVYGIINSLEGTIQATSQPGQGTTFRILLPMAQGLLPAAEPEAPPRLAKGTGRILFVDDDQDFFLAGQRMLEHLGYEVTAHSSSLEAWKEFQARPRHFDLIVSDQTMPGLTGLELAAACSQLRPDIPILLCTGYSESVTPERLLAAGVREVVPKPFDLYQISQVIAKALKK